MYMKKILLVLIVFGFLTSCKNTITGNGIDGDGNLQVIAQYMNNSYVNKVAVSDDYLLINDISDGLSLLYEPNSSSINFLHKLHDEAHAIHFYENRFLFGNQSQLGYYKITDSNDSEKITSYSLSNVNKIEKYGYDYFTLDGSGNISRIRLIDDSFSQIDSYYISDTALDMVLIYPVLAVIDDYFLYIFDISESDFFNLEHTMAFIGATSIDGYNDNLFVSSDIGITRYSIDDYNIPHEEYTCWRSNNYSKIVVDYPMIYTVNGARGIELFEINSETVEFSDSYDLNGIVEDLTVKGRYIYIASGFNGVKKLQYTDY